MHPKKLLYSMIGLFFVGFTFLSPGAVALARQVTATITATFIPPSVTPTTMYNFECPVGTPAGWGTYTPSPLWYLECEYCVWTPTSTALPPTITPTHDGTGTPYPTATVTLTPAVTSTPSNGSFTCLGLHGADCFSGAVSTYEHEFEEGFGNNGFFGAMGIHVLSIPASETLIIYYNFDVLATWTGAHENYSPIIQTRMWAYDPVTSWGGYIYDDWFTGCLPGVAGTCHHTSSGSVTFTNVSNYNEQGFDFWFDFRNPNVSWGSGNTNIAGSLRLSLDGFPSTPTPTSQLTPAGYGFCQTVAPIDPAFGFELFVPDGPANCDMGWDEFGVGDYTIPAVQICFQPSQFGVIRLFGKDYEVGIYGLAAAAAFLWRYFRTV